MVNYLEHLSKVHSVWVPCSHQHSFEKGKYMKIFSTIRTYYQNQEVMFHILENISSIRDVTQPLCRIRQCGVEEIADKQSPNRYERKHHLTYLILQSRKYTIFLGGRAVLRVWRLISKQKLQSLLACSRTT